MNRTMYITPSEPLHVEKYMYNVCKCYNSNVYTGNFTWMHVGAPHGKTIWQTVFAPQWLTWSAHCCDRTGHLSCK